MVGCRAPSSTVHGNQDGLGSDSERSIIPAATVNGRGCQAKAGQVRWGWSSASGCHQLTTILQLPSGPSSQLSSRFIWAQEHGREVRESSSASQHG